MGLQDYKLKNWARPRNTNLLVALLSVKDAMEALAVPQKGSVRKLLLITKENNHGC